MFASIVVVSIDEPDAEEGRRMLEEDIVPNVSAAPGFVSGYWLAPVGNEGTAVVIFDTEEQARATAPPVGANPGPGVTVTSLEFREVVASA